MENIGYKWDAELYDKSSRFQYNLGLMAIDRLNPRDGEKILEVGCGNAMVTIELAKKIPNGKITALELSEDQYHQAKENLNKHCVSNVKIVNQNAIELNDVHEYDAIFSNSAIHWITDLELMYKKIYDALIPGGRIMIQTGLSDMNALFKLILKIIRLEEYRRYLKNFKPPWRFLKKEKNENILRKSGFKKINAEPYDYKIKFKNEEEMWNYFKAAPLVPFLSLIPTNHNESFLKTVKTLFHEMSNNTTTLELRMKRVFLNAFK